MIILPTPTILPPSPTPIPTSIEFIKKVEQKVRERILSMTQPTLTKKGVIGKIITIDSSSLTYDYQNNLTTVDFDPSLIVIDKNRNKTKIDNLKVGQDILILGDQVSDTKFVAKRIIISDLKSIETKPIVVIGKIVDISKTSPVFSLIPTKNKNTQYQIKSDSKSEIQDSQSNQIPQTSLKSGNKIIVILVPDPKMAKTYYAQKIIDLDYTPQPTPTKK